MPSLNIPLILSIASLSCAFNYKLSEWLSGTHTGDRRRGQAGTPELRAAELRRHGYLLQAGVVSLIPTVIDVLVSRAKPTQQMALVGLACGGAATIVTGVFEEWTYYDDGSKVAITGGTLFALLAGAFVVDVADLYAR